MKQIFFGLGIVLIIAACSSQKQLTKSPKLGKAELAQDTAVEDSVEYELETFDSKFETWYQLHDTPSTYRSQEYYESWNQQYVAAWNANAHDPRKGWFFETIIGYDPAEDYGFELNHELFYYFQYVENVLKIRILPNGPNVVKF